MKIWVLAAVSLLLAGLVVGILLMWMPARGQGSQVPGPDSPRSAKSSPYHRPPPPELPSRPSPVTGNERLDQLLAPGRADDPKVTADIRHALPRIEGQAQLDAVLAALRDHRTSDTVRNECLVLLRNSGYADLPKVLMELLEREYEEERIRSFFAQHLGGLLPAASGQEKATMTTVLERCAFDDHDLKVRREAMMALYRDQNTRAMKFAKTSLGTDDSAGMKDLVIRWLYDLEQTDAIADIRPYCYDDDSVVRVAALNILGKWRDHQSEKAFRDAIADENPRIQRAGQLSLDRMMGEKK